MSTTEAQEGSKTPLGKVDAPGVTGKEDGEEEPSKDEEQKGEGQGKDLVSLSTFQIRPTLRERFRPITVKELIHNVMMDELGGKVYTAEDAEKWTTNIANTVRSKVKELGMNRYKYVVQVVIGEQHGSGVKIGARCLWDAEADSNASDVFINDSMFCMTVVFAVYVY